MANTPQITHHYIRYMAAGGQTGIATVPARPGRARPAWSDCARVVPGFLRGEYIAPAPTH